MVIVGARAALASHGFELLSDISVPYQPSEDELASVLGHEVAHDCPPRGRTCDERRPRLLESRAQAAAAAVAAKQRLGSAASNAVKIVDDEVDAIVDPVAQARQAKHGAPPASHSVFLSERALPFRVFTESFARPCRRSRRVRWWRRRSI